MRRLYSLPAIGLILSLVLIQKLAKAQTYFTAEVKGQGKPMLLIHGLYCNGDVWKETIERYQDRYECHVLTLAGFGGNAPHLNDRFLESVKDDIIHYVKNKKLKKPLIMGHSMGGFLSFWAASSAPGLFEKVISVDGLPFLPAISMPGTTSEGAKSLAANIRNAMANLTPEQIGLQQKSYLTTMISNSARIDQVVSVAVKADSKTQAQVMYELFTTDIRPLVASIDCPVLLLGAWIAYKDYGATHDGVLNGYKNQVASVRNAAVEISDTAKHFIFYDDPAWFFEKVDSFIR